MHSAIADKETANPKINLPSNSKINVDVPEISSAPNVKIPALTIIIFLRPCLSTKPPGKS